MQAAKVLQEKMAEIYQIFPFFRDEIFHTEIQKDYVNIWFYNGSRFDVVSTENAQRGGRRNNGLKECLLAPLYSNVYRRML